MLRGHAVAREAERARGGERHRCLGVLRVDQPVDRLDAGDAGADEDRRHDGQAGEALGALGAQQEGDAQRDRGRASPALWIRSASSATLPDATKMTVCAAAVSAEHSERQRDRPHALARALDRVVHEAVAVGVAMGHHRQRR